MMDVDLNAVWRVAQFLASVTALVTLTFFVYQWKFHPLAKYPGPFWAKFSDIPVAYSSLRGRAHLDLANAHKQYGVSSLTKTIGADFPGSVVRVGPNKLAFTSPEALQQIYFSRHVHKSAGYVHSSAVRAGPTNTFNVIDKVEHRRKRRVVGQAFTDRALGEIEPALKQHVDTFVRTLATGDGSPPDSKGWGPPVNVALQSKYLAVDVIGMFAFGKSFDLLTSPANRFIRDVLTAPAFMVGIYYQWPGLSKLHLEQFGLEKLLMWWHGENMSYDRAKFGRLIVGIVQERLQVDKHANKDLFSLLVDAKDPDTGEGLAVEELWAEARVFMVAGSDTTAASLAATFFHLSRHPVALQKLTKAVRATFTSGSDIHSGVAMRDLTYLRACIDEALRLNPAVPIALWREVASPEGISIDRTFVPNGTVIGASLYMVHHDPVVFPDPFRYEPERWLGEPGPALDRMHKAFNPFSLGSRRCVAQNLAYLELQLAVAKTVWYLDARRPDGPLDAVGGGIKGRTDGRGRVEEYQFEEHFVARHDGPYLEFRCREGFENEVAALGT